jgi:hypothetical protein
MSITAAIMLMALQTAPAAPTLAQDYAATAPGTFSSAAQHAADPRYDHVEARIVRIWPERTDGVWLYQEQAIINVPGVAPADARRKPYFQFVARVTPLGDGLLRRDNFRVRDGAAWLAMTSGDARLSTLTPADLAPASCHNRMERVSPGYWTGRTESCTNAYKGATYMVSLSITTRDHYVNWDRGFDAAGTRIWGPADGGYVFDRVGD